MTVISSTPDTNETIGDYTLDTVGTALTSYVAIQGSIALSGNNIVGRFTNGLTGWKATAVAVMQALSPPFYFLLLILFSAGFSLSVLLPAIPFIYWMTGVLNWSVSVLVGCAAPDVVSHAPGHGRGPGKSRSLRLCFSYRHDVAP
ncbi:hypothetical protein CKF46_30570, partial [Klebsiella pneumoniae]